ncbi:class I SAM-dependent rRNA methyltransferase [Prosthecobacter sp. SYSU 5D2]|uniref:class I SAM-dependent rRNA methyltransferase n=1 Tax=Prosthecobacter sp. SYSU 5D2 TaxID=3134134 RepID=UPI0031FF31A4
MPTLSIQPRARIFHGHVWVYATEIKGRFGEPKPGDVVQLQDARGKPMGSAIYNPQSQISARLFSYRRQDLDLDFFTRRIERALKVRTDAGVDTALCRVVWSESDGLPGVIVDRYGDYLVLQTLTLAMAQRQDLIIQALVQIFSPKGIVQRNEGGVRKAEGLEQIKGAVFGEAPAPFIVRHEGSAFHADLIEGQKTGLYLDQLDNYQHAAKLAKGRRVLDCFSNQGGFAQACALAGAVEVTAVDISESATEQAKKNAEISGAKVNFIAANCFDFLKAQETAAATYDLIILDPPSFTKTKAKVQDAMRGYKEIHLRSLKMLQPGGILATFSCSHHVSSGEFHASIRDAAVDARKTLRRIAVYTQRPDHPILATIPETEYLVGYAYEVIAAW